MGLKSESLDSTLCNGESSDDEDFTLEEDYYTTKFIRIRHRKDSSIMSSTSYKSPPRKRESKGRSQSNNMNERKKSSRRLTTMSGDEIASISPKSSMKLHSFVRFSAKSAVMSSGKSKRVDKASRQCNDKHHKRKLDNVENFPPRVNCFQRRNNDVPGGGSRQLKSEANEKPLPFTLDNLIKVIGVKGESGGTKSTAFTQCLDPTIFNNAGNLKSAGCDKMELSTDDEIAQNDVVRSGGASSKQEKSVSEAIFQALFGQTTYVIPSSRDAQHSEIRWDEADDVDEKNDLLEEVERIPAVDEDWFTGLIENNKRSRSGSSESDASQEGNCRRSRSNSMTLGNPLLGQSNVVNDITPFLTSKAIEYALCSTTKDTNIACDENGIQNKSSVANRTKVSLLEDYITLDLVNDLVLQLCHDDDRVMSPRLSVLKALYKNCPSMKGAIINVLELATYNRVLRCKEKTELAKSRNMHYDEASKHVLRQDFSELSSGNQDKEALGGESSPTLQFDHDGSIVELTLFIVVTESSSHSATKQSDQTPSTLCDTIIRVVSNVMRCYGSHLSSAVGSVETCPLLQGVVDIIRTLFQHFSSRDDSSCCSVEALLDKILKYFPRGDTMRELAFWHVIASALPFVSSSNIHQMKSLEPQLVSRLSYSKIPSSQRLMKKLINAVSSSNFKIANKTIQVVMNQEILEKFFLSSDESNDNSWVEGLVSALRNNRQHWHISIRELSENALDILMDCL